MNNDWPCASGWGLSVLIRSMHYRGRWSVKQWALSFRRLPPPQLQAMEGREATGYTSDAKGSGDIQHADEINGEISGSKQSRWIHLHIWCNNLEVTTGVLPLQLLCNCSACQPANPRQQTGGPHLMVKEKTPPTLPPGIRQSVAPMSYFCTRSWEKKTHTLFFFSDWQLQHSVLFDQLIKGTLQTSAFY